MTQPPGTTTYRLAPALGARLVGRSLVTLAVLVVVAALVAAATGGWAVALVGSVAGLALVALWAWWLLRKAWVLRLTREGYAVRMLRGVGVASGRWTDVVEVRAGSPGGEPYLVLQLRDGGVTRLPMSALAADRDAVAVALRRRVRDAHTPGGAGPPRAGDAGPA